MPPFAGNEFGGMRLPSGEQIAAEGIVLPKFIGSVANLATATVLVRPDREYKWLYVCCHNMDDAAGAAVTFAFRNGDYVPRTAAAATNVDITDNEFDITAHGYETGDGPYKMTTTTTLPGGILATTIFWVRRVTADAVSFHPTYADAIAGTNEIDLTSTGTGTHTISGMPVPSSTNPQATSTDGMASLEIGVPNNRVASAPSDGFKLLKFLAPEKMTVIMSAADVNIGFSYWWTK